MPVVVYLAIRARPWKGTQIITWGVPLIKGSVSQLHPRRIILLTETIGFELWAISWHQTTLSCHPSMDFQNVQQTALEVGSGKKRMLRGWQWFLALFDQADQHPSIHPWIILLVMVGTLMCDQCPAVALGCCSHPICLDGSIPNRAICRPLWDRFVAGCGSAGRPHQSLLAPPVVHREMLGWTWRSRSGHVRRGKPWGWADSP